MAINPARRLSVYEEAGVILVILTFLIFVAHACNKYSQKQAEIAVAKNCKQAAIAMKDYFKRNKTYEGADPKTLLGFVQLSIINVIIIGNKDNFKIICSPKDGGEQSCFWNNAAPENLRLDCTNK